MFFAKVIYNITKYRVSPGKLKGRLLFKKKNISPTFRFNSKVPFVGYFPDILQLPTDFVCRQRTRSQGTSRLHWHWDPHKQLSTSTSLSPVKIVTFKKFPRFCLDWMLANRVTRAFHRSADLLKNPTSPNHVPSSWRFGAHTLSPLHISTWIVSSQVS